MSENENSQPQKRRFYDRDTVLSNSVELIKTFPADIQYALAKGMSMIAIKDYAADEKVQALKSLGIETVLPLYKSKQKRRHYDSNTDFHNSINYFRILTTEERHGIARKVMDITHQVRDYLQKCKEVKTAPNQQNVENIRDTYVEHGAESAKKIVETLCDDLSAKANKSQTNISLEENRVRGVTQSP